jgi:hypothetical protein
MSVKSIHEYLEKACPDGAAFAIEHSVVSALIEKKIKSLATGSGANTNIALNQSSGVRFSFLFDDHAFALSPNLELSIDLRVWLHPTGQPNNPIVTLLYRIARARIQPLYDTTISEFCWISVSTGSVTLVSETWGTDQALIDAGYEKTDHTTDKQRFLEEIFYGFKWVNDANLLPSIIRNIPFPQLQKWFLPFALQFPFDYAIQDGYLIIWTKLVSNIFHNCGPAQTPSTPPKSGFQVRAGSPAPSSPYDNYSPPFALYIAATNLVSWQANQLAPAVMLSGSGGGFIRWGYDLAVGVKSFMLDLIPAPNGGGLALHLDLRVAGIATAWIDGPSGTRLSLASCSLTADGTVDASAVVEYVPKTGQIDLDTTIHAAIDKSSIDLSGGGLFNEVEADVIEFLIKSGLFNIDTSYYSRTRMPLVNLNDVTPRTRSQALQRIGDLSMLTFYIDKDDRGA